MAPNVVAAAVLFAALVKAQTPSNSTPEVHPVLETYKCTKAGGCVSQNTAIVLDASAHWIHQANDTSLGCTNGGTGVDPTACPDEASCARNCILEGIDDYASHGITTSGSSMTLDMLSDDGTSLSPRVYLLGEDQQNYELLQLTGNELSFDVDVSKLPCGMNGALYLSEMDGAGGRSALNAAGATYGTGYCDAQCFVTPFINGEGNIDGAGACCNEMDIWEANKAATQLAPHTCNATGLYECQGDECGATGVCDKNGCGQNPYAFGAHSYYGPSASDTINTNLPFTVVTQFPTDDAGNLVAIRRLYVQNSTIINMVSYNATVLDDPSAITDEYCSATGATKFIQQGALEGMGGALSRGMVLIFSVWWDTSGYMNWLDNGNAGPCNATEGNPTVIEAIQPDTAVTFSQIKWGEIDSTYSASTSAVRRRYQSRL